AVTTRSATGAGAPSTRGSSPARVTLCPSNASWSGSNRIGDPELAAFVGRAAGGQRQAQAGLALSQGNGRCATLDDRGRQVRQLRREGVGGPLDRLFLHRRS